MGNSKEDISQNFRTIFFVILFFLFALSFSDKKENQTSLSGYPSQNEPAFGNILIRFDAAVFNAVSLPDLYEENLCALHNTGFSLFSLQYKISNYDQRTTQNFIGTQKTRLTIEPLFLWRLYHPFSLSEKEDLPVLS
jgi:hypothetical protein